jgi:pilus assembly protein Flp/PilA
MSCRANNRRNAGFGFKGATPMWIENFKLLRALVTDRKGVTALEYALIAGVLATVVLVGFTEFGNSLTNVFHVVALKITPTS